MQNRKCFDSHLSSDAPDGRVPQIHPSTSQSKMSRIKLNRWLQKFGIFLTACLLTLGLIKLYWTLNDTRGSASYMYVYDYSDISTSGGDLFERPIRLPDLHTVRELAHRIVEVSKNLITSTESSSSSSSHLKDALELSDIARQLYPPIDMSSIVMSTPIESPVCTEEYLGSELLDEAWRMTNCTTSKPIQSLVTVLFHDVDDESTALQLVSDLHSSYSGIPIVFIGGSKFSEDIKTNGKMEAAAAAAAADQSVKWVPSTKWRTAIESVKTTYVLVARKMFRFSRRSSLLERLVRVLSTTPGLAAVGGAVRNATDHWSVGCFQSRLRNYALVYTVGYHHSHADCMLCDYLDGPFLIRTRLLHSLPDVDSQLPPEVQLADLFLVFSRRYLSMACPDVMFYSNGPFHSGGATSVRTVWLPFVRKWQLNRILLDHQHLGRVLHKFTCSESEVRCDNLVSSTASYAMPTCCQEQMAAAYNEFATFCRNHSIGYLYDSGTALGAVKMSDVIQWDFDGDALFAESNYSFIRHSAITLFADRGLSLALVTPHSSKKNSLFHLWTPDVFVELYGQSTLPSDRLIGTDGPLMAVREFWVRGPVNPGLYARGRYGRDCLRHVQSWRHTGAEHSFLPYASSVTFASCPRALHHSCLDRFPVDGSIPFQVPEF